MYPEPQVARVALLTSIPRNDIQHQATIALNCVSEHACFILIYFVQVSKMCLEVIASLPILVDKRFHRNAIFV